MQKLKLIRDLSKLEYTAREQIKNVFSKGDRIVVKFHMGETSNKYYIKAPIIKRIINLLNGLGLKPFLFDSPARYEGGRSSIEDYYKTAASHGFTEENIGCPIIISDESVDVKTKNLKIHVCRSVAEAEGVLVVSHVKGHVCCGVGGAIKNLGMGCVSKDSKGDIHEGAMPKVIGICRGCGLCKENCPADSIEIIDGKASFDLDGCWGCSTCILSCPYGALEPRTALFDDLLAQGAQAVLSRVKKVFFINFLIDIAKKCDCANDAGPIVVKDIGALFGKDAVAIDKASIDLINKQKKDIFKDIHHHDPYLQIKYAKGLKIGEEGYDIS